MVPYLSTSFTYLRFVILQQINMSSASARDTVRALGDHGHLHVVDVSGLVRRLSSAFSRTPSSVYLLVVRSRLVLFFLRLPFLLLTRQRHNAQLQNPSMQSADALLYKKRAIDCDIWQKRLEHFEAEMTEVRCVPHLFVLKRSDLLTVYFF